MNLPDLNDLQFFAGVVEHGGYAAAERALGIPKSRLSRRIAQLEADLGVRLLQRSTRKFAVTEIGQDVYRHAQNMIAESQAAREAVVRVDIRPVLMTQDFGVLKAAAKAGQGIALLPETACADAVRAGELKLVFRDWQLPQGICHAVYPSRRGVLPAVRAWIDFLSL